MKFWRELDGKFETEKGKMNMFVQWCQCCSTQERKRYSIFVHLNNLTVMWSTETETYFSNSYKLSCNM